MKFSIITATYNREKTIKRSIESTQEQTYKNIELLIIDGISTDKTTSIIQPLLSEDDYFISEKDGGIYDALNKGLKISNGDIIGFMHSDDCFFDKNVIAEVASLFKKTNADIVYGDAIFFNEVNFNKITRYYKSDELSSRNLAWGKMPAHTAMFIKKSVYKKHGYFKTNYKICADYEFLCRISKKDSLKSVYVSRPFVKMQTGGISTGGIRNTIILNREVIRACLENNIYTNLFMVLSKYPSKILQYLKTRNNWIYELSIINWT